MKNIYLDDLQLEQELKRCLQCKAQPCMKACPTACSPHDFIAAAKQGNWGEAAELISKHNPLGEVCGLVCPDKFCVKACIRAKIDSAVKIPQVQASIMLKARNTEIQETKAERKEQKVAVIGLGPSGIGAISELLKCGFAVEAYERQAEVGGALNLIPVFRLPREVLRYEWDKLRKNERLQVHLNSEISKYTSLLQQGFAAVIVAVGEQAPRRLNVAGEELTVSYKTYLQKPENFVCKGNVAVIGGGEAAADCAITAALSGAASVEMAVRRRLEDMRISKQKHQYLQEQGITVCELTRPTGFTASDDGIFMETIGTRFDNDGKLCDNPQCVRKRKYDLIITALGSTGEVIEEQAPNMFFAGDIVNGSSTVVEAVASGQNAAKRAAEYLGGN